MGGPNPMCHPKGVPWGVPTLCAILRRSQMGGSQPYMPSQVGPNPMCHPKEVPWGVPTPCAILRGSHGGSQPYVPS